ncbi:MAG: glycosyltransferase family 4 protein [Tateyamaria sp.]|uniref:glycosyltransferase family 4 protein n=1 Tax=Tateyamaria sp. TaxID=1929288 RepID=UPI0032DC447C
MKVLIIAPNVDATDVGEAFVAFKWVEALSRIADVTVLAFQRAGRPDLAGQLPHARVVTWPEPSWARRNERLNAMLKPAWPVFSTHVRKWMKSAVLAGEDFDIAHQLMPQAARYPSPLRHFEVPYIIGPLGGAMDTPETFRDEAANAPLFTRLRALDQYRFRYDPLLRKSYSRAACILGVAPYVEDILADIPLRRFEPVLELGVDDVEQARPRTGQKDQLRVLHVGRGVRTKGLRDTVRALAGLKDLQGVTLTSAGSGEEIEICRAEAKRLGVADRVTFRGKISREEVEQLYSSHDVFCFPSFREPAGGVLYEAMRHGLPVIAADRGGPASIIDASSGVRIPVTEPVQFAQDISAALRQFAQSPALRTRLGEGAQAKVSDEGLWSAKADGLISLYKDILECPSVPTPTRKVSSATPIVC